MNHYYDNMNLLRFDTKVVSCIAREAYYDIVLEETAFYPEKGGMTKDTGTLNGIRVLDVFELDGNIVHVLDQPIMGQVHGEIDDEQRLHKCQVHTAQHILSYYIETHYPLQTSSHHVSGPNADIAFAWQVANADIPMLDLHHLQASVNQYANAMIRENRTIHIIYPTYEEFQTHQKKTDFGINDEVRIVKLGEEDYNFCGCIHVPSTSYIQTINVFDIVQTKTGIVVYYQAGEPLRIDYQQRLAIMKNVSVLMKFNEYDLLAGVENLLRQKQELEHQLQISKLLYLDTLFESLMVRDEDILIAEYETLSTKEGQILASRLTTQGKVVYLVLKIDDHCHIIFASPKGSHYDMKADYVLFGSRHQFKGGGNPSMAQGGGAYLTSHIDEIHAIAQERKQHNEQ